MAGLKRVWVWLKANWQWVLFPIGIALFLMGRYSRPADLTVVDPLEDADARQREEGRQLQEALEHERQLVREQLDTVHRENRDTIARLTEEQRLEAARLEDDPEALNKWLRSL
jgi:hypothetical protein